MTDHGALMVPTNNQERGKEFTTVDDATRLDEASQECCSARNFGPSRSVFRPASAKRQYGPSIPILSAIRCDRYPLFAPLGFPQAGHSFSKGRAAYLPRK